MPRRSKILILAIGLTMFWAANFGLRASAQESHEHNHEHSHAPASAKKLKNPLTATEENIAGGRTFFKENCASCHGQDGKGQTEKGAAMKVKPADLTGLHGRTAGEIYWVITNGIKASGMPGFKAKMKDKERYQTTLYVQHLAGPHSPGAPAQPHEHAGHTMPGHDMSKMG